MKLIGLLLTLALVNISQAHAQQRVAHYLANEGVMIQRGDLKVVFDPLFDNDYGQFETLPDAMRSALLAGDPPYDALSAAFVSHSHEDHFSPADMRLLMEQHADLHLYASKQAVDDLMGAEGFDDALLERITAISPKAQPQTFRQGDMVIDAFTIPHSGWPNRMTGIHNVVYRVTLVDTTILHMGDSDTSDQHFAPYGDHWRSKHIDMAFPPYWYFFSESGKTVLSERLRPGQVVGIHVPKAVPDNEQDRPATYRGPDLFTIPGETREILVEPLDNAELGSE